jgi:hypothetical protein
MESEEGAVMEVHVVKATARSGPTRLAGLMDDCIFARSRFIFELAMREWCAVRDPLRDGLPEGCRARATISSAKMA